MESRSANNWFPIMVWLLTVAVIGPILLTILMYFSQPVSIFQSKDPIINLRLTIIFGLLFSLPVFGIYLLIFKILTNKYKSPIFIKVCLTAVCVIGMYITFYIMSGTSIDFYNTLPYPISTIISSSIFKVYK